MESEELTAYLHEQIPLTAAMRVSVLRCSADEVALQAPLSANTNHKRTAFGGSVSTLAIVSAWSLVFVRLRVTANEIVIQESHTSYLKPITGDFVAVCRHEDTPGWLRFERAFHRHGRARIHLQSRILSCDETAALFEGKYVAINMASGQAEGQPD